MNARIVDRLWTAGWAVLLVGTLAVAAVAGPLFWAQEALGQGPKPQNRKEEDLLEARPPDRGAVHEM